MRGVLHHLGERHTHCNLVVAVAVHLKQCLRQRSVTQERTTYPEVCRLDIVSGNRLLRDGGDGSTDPLCATLSVVV
jgi:hypothetical protein